MSVRKLTSIHEESAVWRATLEAEERALECALRRHRAPTIYVCDRSPIPEFPVEARGVYVARYLSPKGRYILNCIDRRGRHVAQLVIDDPARWVEYERAAQSTLDELDPGLKLIT